MQANEGSVPLSTTEQAALQQELQAVQQQLQDALTGLYPPFHELAQSQLSRALPLRRAAVVLATAIRAEPETMLRQQRIDLATALEMLNIALVIHQFLLASAEDQQDNPNQRSITGSIILTGDYCFTQAALFAAKTENVQVVAIFSEALKNVSEGLLRRLFTERGLEPTVPSSEEFDTEVALCAAGIHGAVALLTPDSTAGSAIEAIEQPLLALVDQWAPDWQPSQIKGQLSLAPLSNAQQRRWQALQQWLIH